MVVPGSGDGASAPSPAAAAAGAGAAKTKAPPAKKAGSALFGSESEGEDDLFSTGKKSLPAKSPAAAAAATPAKTAAASAAAALASDGEGDALFGVDTPQQVLDNPTKTRAKIQSGVRRLPSRRGRTTSGSKDKSDAEGEEDDPTLAAAASPKAPAAITAAAAAPASAAKAPGKGMKVSDLLSDSPPAARKAPPAAAASKTLALDDDGDDLFATGPLLPSKAAPARAPATAASAAPAAASAPTPAAATAAATPKAAAAAAPAEIHKDDIFVPHQPKKAEPEDELFANLSLAPAKALAKAAEPDPGEEPAPVIEKVKEIREVKDTTLFGGDDDIFGNLGAVSKAAKVGENRENYVASAFFSVFFFTFL